MIKLEYYKRGEYGNIRKFPSGTEFVVAHTLISGQKTLSQQHIEGYEMLGLKVKEVKAPEEK